MPYANGKSKYEYLMRKYCNNTILFTDVWCPGEHEQEVPEDELLLGELLASIFSVGYYIVRSAIKVYKISDSKYIPELEILAEQAEVDLLRKMGYGKNCLEILRGRIEAANVGNFSGIPVSTFGRDKLRITHEISARHLDHPNNTFTYICRSASARDGSWCEYIGDIYAVKRSEFSSDESASLLVYSHYECHAYGIDTWYEFDPTGKVAKYVLNPFHLDLSEARFI